MKNNWKCICKGKEESGDYSHMAVFEFEGKEYQVDTCLENEIKYLLSQGVKTVASCCGHKRLDAFIAVKNEYKYIEMMKHLGYERYINPHCPEAMEFFKPKTK